MYLSSTCPTCGGVDVDTHPAIVAPFIAARALRRPVSRCRLLECKRCEVRFFDVRYDDEEVQRLYSDYRGEEYFRQRHAEEFWYSRKTNARLGEDQSILDARRATLRRFLAAHADLSEIDTVLDYGGDQGQSIPDVGSRRFVFDLSGVRPVEGVSAIASEGELAEHTFDLVMLCHVLEHVSNPRELLTRIRRLGSSPEALFYFEVPFERPRLGGVLGGRLGEAWLDALISRPSLLKLVDFYSTLGRVGANVIPPFGFPKAHEHVNFFVEKSLRAVLEAAGYSVIASEVAVVPQAVGGGTVIGCLARGGSRAL